MDDVTEIVTDAPAADPMDRLGHLLIRAHNGDTLDPFFIEGHPNIAYKEGRLVRSCFYYSVVMNERLAVLYDNDGAGGMCDLEPYEIVAVWRTPRLMESLGVTFEDLRAGKADIGPGPAPEPCWRHAASDPKWAGEPEAAPAP